MQHDATPWPDCQRRHCQCNNGRRENLRRCHHHGGCDEGDDDDDDDDDDDIRAIVYRLRSDCEEAKKNEFFMEKKKGLRETVCVCVCACVQMWFLKKCNETQKMTDSIHQQQMKTTNTSFLASCNVSVAMRECVCVLLTRTPKTRKKQGKKNKQTKNPATAHEHYEKCLKQCRYCEKETGRAEDGNGSIKLSMHVC